MFQISALSRKAALGHRSTGGRLERESGHGFHCGHTLPDFQECGGLLTWAAQGDDRKHRNRICCLRMGFARHARIEFQSAFAVAEP